MGNSNDPALAGVSECLRRCVGIERSLQCNIVRHPLRCSHPHPTTTTEADKTLGAE